MSFLNDFDFTYSFISSTKKYKSDDFEITINNLTKLPKNFRNNFTNSQI